MRPQQLSNENCITANLSRLSLEPQTLLRVLVGMKYILWWLLGPGSRKIKQLPGSTVS